MYWSRWTGEEKANQHQYSISTLTLPPVRKMHHPPDAVGASPKDPRWPRFHYAAGQQHLSHGSCVPLPKLVYELYGVGAIAITKMQSCALWI